MIWAAAEKQLNKETTMHAGGKARDDLNKIFLGCGIRELPIVAPQLERKKASAIKKAFFHIQIERIWMAAVDKMSTGDILLLQFPLINHTLFFNSVVKHARKKGIKLYAFIHDLELIRRFQAIKFSPAMKWRMKREELDELNQFDGIVVHNKKMKVYLHDHMGIPNEKMVELEIFDYLIPEPFQPLEEIGNYKTCVIAGNFHKNKSGYAHDLPTNVEFELYGINFEKEYADNIHYHGAFPADELPFHLSGGFGLVWDGDGSDTCRGVYGEYLRYNNPHKTSLYLACGIPVIIWEEAALADFIVDNQLGFTVKSIDEIGEKFELLTEAKYREFKQNAVKISDSLRNGSHTINALKQFGLDLS